MEWRRLVFLETEARRIASLPGTRLSASEVKRKIDGYSLEPAFTVQASRSEWDRKLSQS